VRILSILSNIIVKIKIIETEGEGLISCDAITNSSGQSILYLGIHKRIREFHKWWFL
jgi:hypothetical protein